MKIFKGREFLRILEASVVIYESVFYVCVCVCVCLARRLTLALALMHDKVH